ncbi:MAG: metalloregulator ArsR/SmtB family transcription factor [Proteobacteria bacterium]|nr:metalloregulator ArsR/SmtB family transcription factor [Pseudomonadota bacterium]
MDNTISKLKALADKNRLRVFCALTRHGELCACQITELLQVAGATASRHLSILVAAGLLTSRKDGRWVFFSLDRSGRGFDGILQWLDPEVRTSLAFQNDLDTLERITDLPLEDLCRKQRGQACCPIQKGGTP